jgi:hypothetical protein
MMQSVSPITSTMGRSRVRFVARDVYGQRRMPTWGPHLKNKKRADHASQRLRRSNRSHAAGRGGGVGGALALGGAAGRRGGRGGVPAGLAAGAAARAAAGGKPHRHERRRAGLPGGAAAGPRLAGAAALRAPHLLRRLRRAGVAGRPARIRGAPARRHPAVLAVDGSGRRGGLPGLARGRPAGDGRRAAVGGQGRPAAPAPGAGRLADRRFPRSFGGAGAAAARRRRSRRAGVAGKLAALPLGPVACLGAGPCRGDRIGRGAGAGGGTGPGLSRPLVGPPAAERRPRSSSRTRNVDDPCFHL